MDFSWLRGKRDSNKKMFYLIIIGTVAFIFLLISSLTNKLNDNNKANSIFPKLDEQDKHNSDSITDAYPNELEEKLKTTLKQVYGVGEVTVMIKFVSGPQIIYAYNTTTENKVIEEKDMSGGTRLTNEQRDASNLVLIQNNGATSNQPVIVKKIEPEISGVLIVAEGAELSLVRAQLIKATQTVLNIPSYKINILPRER